MRTPSTFTPGPAPALAPELQPSLPPSTSPSPPPNDPPIQPFVTIRPRAALAGLSLAMLLSSLGTSVANVGLPTFTRVFDASFAQAQWIVLAYLLATTTLVVAAGRLGDRFGRRRVLVLGIALFTVASAGCSLAPTLSTLIVARAVQGAGAAVMMALTLAFVSDLVPKEKAGRAMGLLGAMSAVGTALGPAAGGLLLSGGGWPMLFVINVPLGILAAWLTLRYVPVGKPAARTSASMDVPGMLLLMAALLAYALAMTLHARLGSRGVISLLMIAAASMALFAWIEVRAASPLIRLDVLRQPGVGSGVALSALVSTVVMATLVVGPFYLSLGLGLRAAQVGLVMAAGPIVAAVMSLFAGRWVDRCGALWMTRAGLGGLLAGALSLAVMPLTCGVPGYGSALVVLTAGYAVFQTANNAGVMAGVSSDQRGVVGGALALARNLGLVSGASLMGAVFLAGAKTSDIASASPVVVAAGMHLTLWTAAALIAAGLLIAGATRR